MNNLLYYECVKNITASDGTAHARPAGAQPLVLVHGLFGSGSNLGSLARLFIHERPVYLVDLPNHGRSPWITDTSYPTAAAFLHRTLQQISEESGVEELHVFGHSMGGKVVMALGLLQNPSPSQMQQNLSPSQTQETEGDYRIASLIIGDIAPRRYDA
ncbi:MAG: alpha/beta fold hydrolase, partial [Salinispira sp.]